MRRRRRWRKKRPISTRRSARWTATNRSAGGRRFPPHRSMEFRAVPARGIRQPRRHGDRRCPGAFTSPNAQRPRLRACATMSTRTSPRRRSMRWARHPSCAWWTRSQRRACTAWPMATSAAPNGGRACESMGGGFRRDESGGRYSRHSGISRQRHGTGRATTAHDSYERLLDVPCDCSTMQARQRPRACGSTPELLRTPPRQASSAARRRSRRARSISRSFTCSTLNGAPRKRWRRAATRLRRSWRTILPRARDHLGGLAGRGAANLACEWTLSGGRGGLRSTLSIAPDERRIAACLRWPHAN